MEFDSEERERKEMSKKTFRDMGTERTRGMRVASREGKKKFKLARDRTCTSACLQGVKFRTYMIAERR